MKDYEKKEVRAEAQKGYETPELTELGTIHELTQGGVAGSADIAQDGSAEL